MKRVRLNIKNMPATLKGGKVDLNLSKSLGNLITPLESATSGLDLGDGVFKKTIFAGTNENKEAFGLAGTITSQAAQIQGELPATLTVNGIPMFAGKCNVQGVDEGGNIVTEMVSEDNALWETLSKKSLIELDLGIEHHNITAIKASFSNTYTGGDKGIFAPVWYGLPTPPASLFDYPWRAEDFRYHVFFPTITYAIFKEAGFSVQSDFFSTEYFRRWVYVYGAGDGLKKVNVIENCTVSARNTSTQSIGIGVVKINMPTELSDPCGQWNTSTSTFTAVSSGVYVFQLFVRASSTVTTVRIDGNVFGPVSPGSGVFDVTHNLTLSAGQTVIFEAQGTASGDSVFDATISISGGDTNSDTNFDFLVSSCLHDNPCKDFLSGITHLFNLVWFVNPITKVVYCEPMFDYYLNGRSDPDGPEFSTKYEGWYRQVSTENSAIITVKCPPGAYQIDFIAPFGGLCNMGFKENKDDPVFTYHKDKDTSDTIDPFTVQLSFNPRGNESKDFRNPYFTAMLNVDAPGVTGGVPSALPNGKNLIVQNDSKDFEHEPQCGIIYRNYLFIYIEDDTSSTNAPLIVGVRDKEFFVNTAPDGYDYFGGCYADVQLIPSGVIVPGLFSTFYKQWYAILRHGQVVTLNGIINPIDFAGEDFKILRRIDTGHDQFLAILAEINDYEIVGTERAESVFVKWRSALDSTDVLGISQNSEKIYPPRVF